MMLCIEIPTRTRDQRRFYLPVTAVSTLKPLQALNQGSRWAGGAEPGQTSSRSVTDSRDSKVPGPLVGGKRFWPLVHQDPRRSSCLQLQAFHVADTFCPLISCYPAKKKAKTNKCTHWLWSKARRAPGELGDGLRLRAKSSTERVRSCT